MPYSVTPLRTVHVDRYVLAMREGGSVPGLIEADDCFKYVLKYRGAAQGPKVLIAELLGGEIARAMGLKVPELVFVELDKAFGRVEQDEEIQDQLKASAGLNIGLHYLQGSITFDANVMQVDAKTASKIVWLDSLITNIDRTARNTNMLSWNRELWLIDHGAALYFHYNWAHPAAEQALRPFVQIKDHVLLPKATMLDEVNEEIRAMLSDDIIKDIVQMIPEDWLSVNSPYNNAEEHRGAYEQFLLARIAHSPIFVKEAKDAR